jgi:hypothetical protein
VVLSQVHRSAHTLDHRRVQSHSDEVQLAGKLPAVTGSSWPTPARNICKRPPRDRTVVAGPVNGGATDHDPPR